MAVPVFQTAYSFFVSLADALDPSSFLANPTIEAGDFKVSVDGGTFANLTNLPVVTPSGGITVQISLTANEMDGEKINVQAIDVADNEWQDLLIAIDVPSASTETINDIQEGDRTETSVGLRIDKKGTTDAVLDKAITGSLLSPGVSIKTNEAP